MSTGETQQNLFKPRRVVGKMHFTMVNQFVIYWVNWKRPCDFKVQSSKRNPEWIGIIFNVENDETFELMEEIEQTLKIKFVDL